MDREPGDDRRDRRSLRRLADGDRDALTELFDAHAERLFGHALWLTRRRAEAEDAVQTVFVKLAERGGELLRVRRPEAYLHRMLRSTIVDDARRRERRPEEALDDAELLVADSADAEALAEAKGLERALAALPAEQREAVGLHLFEGHSFGEIGRLLEVSRFTVASRYRLAIARLRRTVEGDR
ncbi:MAG: sigma-70 family RNA polymerase sigma factor [bacterium]|nr:sigma-70 family RNA polymerase sigma factor [bacterium]